MQKDNRKQKSNNDNSQKLSYLPLYILRNEYIGKIYIFVYIWNGRFITIVLILKVLNSIVSLISDYYAHYELFIQCLQLMINKWYNR